MVLNPQGELFQEALTRIGFSHLSAQEFIENGIDNLARLRRLIKQIHRDNQGQGQGLFIPFLAQQHIKAIRFWTTKMYIMGRTYHLDDVNQQLAEVWLGIMNAKEEASKAPTDLIKTPEPFKKDTKWRPWKESFTTYLHSKHGQAGIPLTYIIHEYDAPLPNVPYPTIHNEMVDCAILQGPEYNINNGIVFDLLQSLTLQGPAWAWISAYEQVRDGRSAWKALISFYEGDSMKTRTKQE